MWTTRCGPVSPSVTFHFPDDVPTNFLTNDATDPKVGTAEFKATAIRLRRIREPDREPTTSSGSRLPVPGSPLPVAFR